MFNESLKGLKQQLENDLKSGHIPIDSIKKGIEDAKRTSSRHFSEKLNEIDNDLLHKRLTKWEK